MKDLKESIKELETITDKKEIETKLQLLGKTLITEYIIRIGDITVEPLWVEAYYSNKKVEFVDPFIHGNGGKEEQSEFDILYFHHKTDDTRSGVDLCLSLCKVEGYKSEKPYYLSYLLKYTLVNGEFTTQSQLSAKIRKAYDSLQDKHIVFQKKNDGEIVGYTARINLKVNDSDPEKNTKEKYAPLNLAIAKNFDKKYSIEKKLPKKEALADSFLSTYNSSKEKWCIEHLGYCPEKYIGQ